MSIKGPNSQIDEIENLLVKWIEENHQTHAIEALVALACARDSIDTIIRTVHVLVTTKDELNIKIMDLLADVLTLDYKDQQPKVLDVSYHQHGFHYSARYVEYS